MKEIEKVVAENITKLLKEKRITKLELAKIAGVSELIISVMYKLQTSLKRYHIGVFKVFVDIKVT